MLRRHYLGFVFQSFNLLARTSAVENVELPLIYRRVPVGERRRRALAVLDDVGLASRARHILAELLGGQQQCVAIARAIVIQLQMLFADEPTGNLDSATSEEIMRVFENLADTGQTVIMVTHEPDIAAHARRVVVLRDGQIASDDRREKFTEKLGLSH